MRFCWPLLLFLFLSFPSFAQESLMRKHYYHDTCPDPATNHIRSRKYYEVVTDTSNHWTINDSVTEYYDRKGKLTSIICRNGRWKTKDHVKNRHYFYYDRKGRITCDSSFKDGKTEVITYEYHGTQAIIRNHPSQWSDILPLVYINYDADGNRVSQYRVNAAGDTVNAWIVNGNTTTDTWFRRAADGTSKPSSTTVKIKSPGRMAEYVTIYHDDDTSRTVYLNAYNPAGKIIEHIYVGDEERRDTSRYYYTNNLLTFYERRVFVHADHHFVQYETYRYNDRGQMTEKRDWSQGFEDNPTVTQYVYNERGLPSEINVWHEYADGRPDYYVRKERFEYTYYKS